ncbi:MAG: NAD-dependent epimerase/dehydratase family protein, partial [Parvularculaceae bacterium]
PDGQPIEVWGDGSVVRDYFYVDDLVEAILAAIAHDGPSRVFNIGSGEGQSVNDIIAGVEKATGREITRRYAPARAIDAPKSVLDIALAGKELGWRPKVPLAEGLARTVQWRRGEGGKE